MIRSYENIVVGSNLEAIIFAYINGYPVFFTQPRTPKRFDYFEPTTELSCVGIPEHLGELRTPNGTKQVGIPKYLLWERLVFLMSLKGDVPLSTLCEKIRYDGEKVVCTNDYSKIYEFYFDTCYYFGDSNTSGLIDLESETKPEYICYDYIAFNRGGKHEIDYISTDDDFVGEIWFYSSDRIDGNTGVKDACVVSRLTEEQLRSPDYSETMARFKMEQALYDNGMKGPFNGYSPTGKPKHYRFKTSYIDREKINLAEPIWEETDSIKANDQTIEELLCLLSEAGLREFENLRCDYTLPA